MRITLLGDVMMSADQLPKFYAEHGYSFEEAFKGLSRIIRKSDFVIANLETPIAGNQFEYTCEPYSFNSPIEFAADLKLAGVDMVTTANNHCLDRGIDGLTHTISNLKKCSLLQIGIHEKKEDSFIIKEIDGIRVGFLAFTYGTNAFANSNFLKKEQHYMVDLLQEQELSNKFIRILYTSNKLSIRVIRKIAKKLRLGQFTIPIYERRERKRKKLIHYKNSIKKCKEAGAEYIICCLHIGGQYNEKPLDYTKEMCQLSLENGADAIIANHEHVIHGIEKKLDPGKFCIYSLGNLLSDAGVTKEPFDKNAEYSVGVHIELLKEGGVIHPKYAFQIFHSFLQAEGKVVCASLYETIQKCTDIQKKKEFMKVNNRLVNKILNTQGIEYPLLEEYFI